MIYYKKGDATLPNENGKVLLGHSVNTYGGWGAGIVVPLGNRYPETKELYLEWVRDGYYFNGKRKIPFRLGEFQSIKINDNFYVANIVAQSGLGFLNWLPPFRPYSFAEALIKLDKYLKVNKFDYFVCPRIGAGLGGYPWDRTVKILEKCITVPVVVYDIEPIEGTSYV